MKKTVLLLVWFIASLPPSVVYSTQPNVIVFLADDQGWGDLSASGNTNLATPNIDSLARDGASKTDELASLANITTASDLLASTDDQDNQPNTPKQIALADFKQGMLVAHQRYGSGVIVSISGTGDKQTATIKFLDQQQRKFRLAFAPLMYIDT